MFCSVSRVYLTSYDERVRRFFTARQHN